jgi:phytoene dehydrogenase-like protein
LTEGNIFHGDLRLISCFLCGPWRAGRDYRSAIPGLYLCSAGTHPGGGVTGAPGHNAARQVLHDWREGRFQEAAA